MLSLEIECVEYIIELFSETWSALIHSLNNVCFNDDECNIWKQWKLKNVWLWMFRCGDEFDVWKLWKWKNTFMYGYDTGKWWQIKNVRIRKWNVQISDVFWNFVISMRTCAQQQTALINVCFQFLLFSFVTLLANINASDPSKISNIFFSPFSSEHYSNDTIYPIFETKQTRRPIKWSFGVKLKNCRTEKN